MKIIIAGGTGFIGSALIQKLAGKNEIVVVSRDPMKASKQFGAMSGLHFVGWDDPVPLIRDTIANSNAIINLSGAPIAAKRWSENYKKKIITSRVESIDRLVQLIEKAKLKLDVVIQASGKDYYGMSEDNTFTESSPVGTGFMADVAKQWESAAKRFDNSTTRLVTLRTGMVLDRSGGALPPIASPIKFFLGGPIGSGKQWVSWIHLEDQIRAIIHLLQTPTSSGAYNLTAPHPITNSELIKTISNVLGRPYWLPTPGFAVRTLFGEMGDELILKGNKVLPEKLMAEKFSFSYETIEPAIKQIYKS